MICLSNSFFNFFIKMKNEKQTVFCFPFSYENEKRIKVLKTQRKNLLNMSIIWISSFLLMQKQNLSIGFLNFVFQFIKKTKWRFGYTDSLHINWRKPNLNAQQNHLAFVCFSFVVFCISLSSIVVISSTLIIGIFYCLKRRLLPALCLAPGLIPGSGP